MRCVGENKWVKTDPIEVEIIGPIRDLTRQPII